MDQPRKIRRDFWTDKKVLVTGHTGFKGGWLTLGLNSLGAKVSGLALPPEDNPSLFEKAEVARLCSNHFGDIRHPKVVADLIEDTRPEIVFHLAAQSLVRKSYESPLLTLETNVQGTANLLEACRKVPSVQAIVVVTTDKVYENEEAGRPFQESDPLGGWDPYSSSKACAEIVASSYRRSFFGGQRIATARGGNTLGGGDWAVDRIVPDLVRAFEKNETALIRYPSARRPWQHVLDCLRGYLLLAESLYQDPGTYARSWNFGPSEAGEKTVFDLAQTFTQTWGETARFDTVEPPTTKKEASFLSLDSSQSWKLLGWKPEIDLNKTVRLCVDWYRSAVEGNQAAKISLTQLTSCWEL